MAKSRFDSKGAGTRNQNVLKRARRDHFLSWYRAIPLLLVLLCGVCSFCYTYAPAFIFKNMFPLNYEEYIKQSSARYGLDPYLVAAVIKTESNWNAQAVSNKGAQGLMQLMPETAQDMVSKGLVSATSYSSNNLSDPAINIEFGCAYLAYLLKYFNGSTDRAIAAYNAGMANVETWAQQNTVLHNAITFPETQAYLIRVNGAQTRYRELYPDAFQ